MARNLTLVTTPEGHTHPRITHGNGARRTLSFEVWFAGAPSALFWLMHDAITFAKAERGAGMDSFIVQEGVVVWPPEREGEKPYDPHHAD